MGVERIRIKGLVGKGEPPPAPETVAVRFSSARLGTEHRRLSDTHTFQSSPLIFHLPFFT